MNFSDSIPYPIDTIEQSYNPYLIVLSVIIAIVSSFTAFGNSERALASTNQYYQALWLIFGAISMGIGIWAMHFIASLALQLPIPITYKLDITLLSVFPAIMASIVVLWLMNHKLYNQNRLIFCGILLGAGICTMHYIGMTAMELNAKMVYLKPIYILSILVAIMLATVALKIKFAATNQEKYIFINKQQILSALVMGIAVSGMHFTAMQAVVFIPVASSNNLIGGIDAPVLSAIISVVVFFVLTVALIIPHMLRFKEMVFTLQKNEENLKIAATAFQTHEAIMVINKNSQIIRVNDAFRRIMGYSESDIEGKKLRTIYSDVHDDFFFKNLWNTIINEGNWSGEIWSMKKNGETFPEWQTISSVKDEVGNTSHYVSFFSDITEFKLAERDVEKLAFYDFLTELPNRRLLHQRLEHELNIARRYNRAGILFFLDLDRFKQINDSLGHSIGDQLLVETSHRLQALLRETDTAVRLGGDEFIILVSTQDAINNDLLRQAELIAKKIIKSINKPYAIENYQLFVTTSIGIALFTGLEETVDSLLNTVDKAMYKAKEAGRNTYCFYEPSMQEVIDTKHQVQGKLENALMNNEFSLHYQPQLSDENKIIGAEALIRWKNPELGMSPPADFIKISEESGLIISIGKWVVETVCDQINIWESQGLDIPHIAINISAKQFHQLDFVTMLVNIVAEKKLSPQKIMLEITEEVFLGNIEEAIDKMNSLKQKGFRFSIDDFGTGYSSLTYLKRLPFEQLKIDQTFIHGLSSHSTDAVIVKAIIVMAKSLGLNLIAEGVETDQQLAYLKRYGCHHYQGYLFSRPLNTNQFTEYVQKHVIYN